jgi:hypothetical protein
MRRILLAALFAVALAVPTACGADMATPAASATTATPTTTVAPIGGAAPTTTVGARDLGPAREVPAALDFAAPLVGGGELDLRQFAGTTVALWFWAPT